MKNYNNFNKHLDAMLEFLELEKEFSNEFIPRVYEAEVNSIANWRSGKPKLSKFLREFSNDSNKKSKKLKKIFNPRISKNPAQFAAVSDSISELYPIYCIQGPPGTGKTSVIVEIIRQELAKYPKKIILITSQSNIAVDNVLEKLIELKKIKLLRLGQEQKISKRVRPYLLDNIKPKLILKNKVNLMLWNLIKFFLMAPLLLLSKNPKKYGKLKSNSLYEIISSQIQVIGATCIGCDDNLIQYLDPKIGLVIVDEAGRSTGMETLIPLQFADRAILVGDQKQLPPVLKPEIKSAWLKQDKKIEDCPGYYSFFEFLQNFIPEKALSVLNVQFRMHPQIGNFVSSVFYQKEGLKTGVAAEVSAIDGFPDAVSYHPTEGYQEERFEKFHEDLQSYYNTAEAKIVLKLIEIVKSKHPELGVSIISFYNAQVELIKQLLAKKQIKNVEVATLDSYQGREQDVIILTLVRSSTEIRNFDTTWYKFFLDIRRLNVAFSRAKRRLMVVGDLERLMEIKGKQEKKNTEKVPGFEVIEKLFVYIEKNQLKVKI